ncbi:MAG TPA: HD-GYP domain-containing protein [Candidatus Limnocylindria bacterium]|nr:HD-GYP domain-containing protein [Candidatus Limnocylindria bacterium]
MRALRLPLRLYVGAVIAAGAAAFAAGTLVMRPQPDDLLAAIVLVGVAVAAQLRPVHLTQKTKLTVEDAATFAAALILHPAPAMLVAGGSTALASLRGRSSWYNRAFNSAAVTIDTGAAAIAFTILSGGAGPSVSTLPAIAIAAVLKFGLNSTIVDLAVALQLRRRPLAKWWARHRRDAVQLLSLYVIGAVGAVAASDSPLTLALFAVPSTLVLFGLRNSARVEARTKQAVHALARLIEQRDRYTYGHSQRVADCAERLARAMRMDQVQIDLIREAALLHDIGKIATPDAVLLKPGSLDAREQEVMHAHAEQGYALLEDLPAFWEGAEFVRSHHERVDGAGYPRGLRGSELPLEVSVIAVADSYDAMTSDRIYRKALPWPVVRDELLRERGRQWHAAVVDAFLAMIESERAEAAA